MFCMYTQGILHRNSRNSNHAHFLPRWSQCSKQEVSERGSSSSSSSSSALDRSIRACVSLLASRTDERQAEEALLPSSLSLPQRVLRQLQAQVLLFSRLGENKNKLSSFSSQFNSECLSWTDADWRTTNRKFWFWVKAFQWMKRVYTGHRPISK